VRAGDASGVVFLQGKMELAEECALVAALSQQLGHGHLERRNHRVGEVVRPEGAEDVGAQRKRASKITARLVVHAGIAQALWKRMPSCAI
jgi:hypothetical protein